MFNRFILSVAALALFSAAPAFATGAHAARGASQQGISTDANFDSPTTVNGIPVTPFFNKNDSVDPLLDIFQIPSNFESGTSYTLTFANINAGYGIFDCNNPNDPTSSVALSADSTPVALNGPCTAEALGSGDQFITFNEVGNKSTITFTAVAGQTPPSSFFFWTPDKNLLGIAAATGTMPEPGTYIMLATGLLAIALMRRRTANNVA
jgi:hypothetical protein